MQHQPIKQPSLVTVTQTAAEASDASACIVCTDGATTQTAGAKVCATITVVTTQCDEHQHIVASSVTVTATGTDTATGIGIYTWTPCSGHSLSELSAQPYAGP